MNPSALAAILIDIISPIILVTALGFVLGRRLKLDPQPLSRSTLYLYSPALIFVLAYRSKLGSEFLTIIAYVILITALTGLITLALIRLMRLDQVTASAFALSTMFVNAGNYGLPLVYFAFGDEGLARAAVYFTFSAMLIQTLAVFIAARGRADAWQAFSNVFKFPLGYGFFIGLTLNLGGVMVPEPLMKSLDLLANAAVPVMLIILGIELSRVSFANDRVKVGVATLVRLAVVPVVAYALAVLMRLPSLTLAICVVQSAMPTAVFASILAVEFQAKPNFVTSTVMVSTIVSVISLTVLLGILYAMDPSIFITSFGG